MQLLLPEGADLESARAMLDGHVAVRGGRVRGVTSTFYDTFDGRLHGAGLSLRHAGGKFVLSERDGGATLAAAEAKAEALLLDEDLPEAVRERLADVIEMRALAPVAKVRTRELPLGGLNGDPKTVAPPTVATHPGVRGRGPRAPGA